MLIKSWQFRPKLWATCLTLLIVALFSALSIWQWHRYHYKKAMQINTTAAFYAPTTDLALTDLHTLLEPNHFIHIHLTGHYDSRQFLLDNRIEAGQAGFDVITPLILTDGSAILINRGFIPADGHRKIHHDITPPKGQVYLTGILSAPSAMFTLGTAVPSTSSWPMIILSVLPATLETPLGKKLSPNILLLDANLPNGFARHWMPPQLWAERSLGYTFQWASFAMMVLIFYVVMNLKKRSSHA